jgi:serine phosphatase RsbU (regulator of sigma subunit)
VLSPRHEKPLCVAVRQSPLTPEQESLLIQLGHAAVLAADALRLYTEEHNLALTLQHSFLPNELPRAEGLETALRYVPAADNAEIGGDFYELIGFDDDRTLIAIGDVAGHSIHAATMMVELRHALRAYAAEDDDPAEILCRLERMLSRYHPPEFATLCLLLLHRRRNKVRIANAGHLPPLLVHEGGAEYLEVYGPMLGLGLLQPASSVHALPPAWSIILVTDGLIEASGIDLDDALEELRDATRLDTAPESCARSSSRTSTAGSTTSRCS